MTGQEKEEIKDLPEKYRTLGAGKLLLYGFLFCLPIVGFIFMVFSAFSNKNIPRREYARQFFFFLLVVAIVSFVLLLLHALGTI